MTPSISMASTKDRHVPNSRQTGSARVCDAPQEHQIHRADAHNSCSQGLASQE